MEEVGKIKTEFKTYEEFEQQVSTELSKQAESFVRLGYLMKIARDTDILQSSGYANVTEFAADKYNLTKDQVSRFIHINDKFSKKGYSEELEDQYKGYGYSKLAVMLTLPGAVVNALDPQMTRNQIIEIQKEYKEEQTISPLETMMEQKEPMQQELTSNLEKFFHQYGHNNREMFKRLADARVKGGDFAENIMDVIAPTGVAQLTERIMGVGKLLLSIKGKDEMIQVVNMREDSTEKFQWSDLCNALSLYGDGSKETWEELYGEPYEAAAEEILEKEKGNDEERDDSRDNKAGEGKDVIHTKDDTKTEKKSEQTEQDAGQISGRGGVEEPQEVAPVQQIDANATGLSDSQGILLSELVYSIIRASRSKLSKLKEFTSDSVGKVISEIAKKTSFSFECDGEDGDYEAMLVEEKMVIYRWHNRKIEGKVAEVENVYDEIARVLETDSEALEEEQIPGQQHIDDPEYKEFAPEDDGYKTIAVRALPGEKVFFILECRKQIEEGIVTGIEIENDLVPIFTVKAADSNLIAYQTYNQKEDWGKLIFKTQEAAERKRERMIRYEEINN